jgi:DNA-binding CsgD family transcriptional regulator
MVAAVRKPAMPQLLFPPRRRYPCAVPTATNLSDAPCESPPASLRTEPDASLASHIRVEFGLTPAEVRVALLLKTGLAISDIAGALRVQRNTIRFHLKNIFLKTGTHRQAALVAFLANIAGLLT